MGSPPGVFFLEVVYELSVCSPEGVAWALSAIV